MTGSGRGAIRMLAGFALFWAFASTLAAVQAEAARVALVVGNSEYAASTKLQKTVNDAEDMAALLQQAGFDLIGGRAHLNQTRQDLLDLNKQFKDALVPGDTAVFYFSGHGFGDARTNFLLPVDDSEITDESDMGRIALDLREVLGAVAARGTGPNILILDACRDYPLIGLANAGVQARGMRVYPNNIGAEDTVILYAALPGQSAFETRDPLIRNSFFTGALLQEISRPGRELREVMRSVQMAVRTQTSGLAEPQVPWREGILAADFFFIAGETPPPPATLPEMVRISGGSFLMGSPDEEIGKGLHEGPQHRVRVPAFEVGEFVPAFEIGKYEVTWGEWGLCVDGGVCDAMGPASQGDDEGWGKGRRPVINVSWHDTQDYIKWLNTQVEGGGYRLPTEAEWEFAARAGTGGRFSWGNQNPVCDEEQPNGANFTACPDDRTRPVGSFQPNPFGLYDMHGNVSEWVADCWNEGYQGAPTDGSAWLSGDCRDAVVRGGSWTNLPRFIRSANRFRRFRGVRNEYRGFRVARTVER